MPKPERRIERHFKLDRKHLEKETFAKTPEQLRIVVETHLSQIERQIEGVRKGLKNKQLLKKNYKVNDLLKLRLRQLREEQTLIKKLFPKGIYKLFSMGKTNPKLLLQKLFDLRRKHAIEMRVAKRYYFKTKNSRVLDINFILPEDIFKLEQLNKDAGKVNVIKGLRQKLPSNVSIKIRQFYFSEQKRIENSKMDFNLKKILLETLKTLVNKELQKPNMNFDVLVLIFGKIEQTLLIAQRYKKVKLDFKKIIDYVLKHYNKPPREIIYKLIIDEKLSLFLRYQNQVILEPNDFIIENLESFMYSYMKINDLDGLSKIEKLFEEMLRSKGGEHRNKIKNILTKLAKYYKDNGNLEKYNKVLDMLYDTFKHRLTKKMKSITRHNYKDNNKINYIKEKIYDLQIKSPVVYV